MTNLFYFLFLECNEIVNQVEFYLAFAYLTKVK